MSRDAGPTPAETPVHVPIAVAEPTPTLVHFVSDPTGARIRVGGILTCVTPCDAQITPPVIVTAELEGYATAERSLPNPAPATVELILPRLRRPGPGPGQHPPTRPPEGPDPPPIWQP